MKCPLCQHPLYHTPPSIPVPYARVYCDGCQGWLAWEATGELTGERLRVDPLCPVCGGGMILRGGNFWGCEDYTRTWPAKGTRSANASRVIDVLEFQLVPWVEGECSEAEARFSRLWREAHERYDDIEARLERYKNRWWERKSGLGGLLDK